MKKDLLLLLLLFLSLFFTEETLFAATPTHNPQPGTISGSWKGLPAGTKPFLYIARLHTIDDFYTADESLRIAKVPLDSAGNFRFSASLLDRDWKCYRLYILPANHSELIRLQPLNFVFAFLKNDSQLNLEITSDAEDVHIRVVNGSPANCAIARFMNHFMGNNTYWRTRGEDDYDKELRRYVSKSDPLITALAYRQVCFSDSKMTPSDKEFLRQQYARLEAKYPDLVYTTETHEKLGIGKVTLPVMAVIVVVGALLIASGVWVLYRYRKRPQTDTEDPYDKWVSLTFREREIVELLVQGCSNKAIAGALHIEISTVKTHVGKVYQKLEISGRNEIVRYAQFIRKPQE